MQIEFSPLYGIMLGINYAHYPETDDFNALHLIQIGVGLVMIQVSWTA